MNAYIYKAALLCENCGHAVEKELIDANPQSWPDREDSDKWPQGPYPNGGGESDSPNHCDHCGLFLENPLTSDGERYVRDEYMRLGRLFRDDWRKLYSYLFKERW